MARIQRVGIAVGLIVAVTAVASACASVSDTTTTGGGGIVIAVSDELRTADNVAPGGTSVDRMMMASTVYEPLFTTGETGDRQPALAIEAVGSKDSKTWTVTLRDGVTFSNGNALTADVVVANFDAFMDEANASIYLNTTANVDSVVADGPDTVVFTLESPDARWPDNLQDAMYIADMDSREAAILGPDEVPVGTGPYSWDSRTIGASLKFVPNPSYWRGVPPLSSVEFRVIPDPQGAVLSLQTGEVDMIANYSTPQALNSLKNDSNVTVVSTAGSTYYHAFLNFEKDRKGGYADGAAVREGLAHLVDREGILSPLIEGSGELATQPIPPWMPGNNPDLTPFDYDPELGVQLLAEGGIEKGDTISIISQTQPVTLCNWATAVQSSLNELGYDAQLQCLESSVAIDKIVAYDWDLLFWYNGGRANAAVMYNQRFGVAAATPPTDTYTLQDEALQSLVDEMAQTQDETEYAALGAQVADRLMKVDVASIPGYFANVNYPINNRVQGFKLSPSTWYGILYNGFSKVTVD